jgi:hypothetical protein
MFHRQNSVPYQFSRSVSLNDPHRADYAAAD